jgi:tRNA modification GTPase
MSHHRDDPIIAIATPAGRGGIGVVRVSFGRWSHEPIVADFIAALCGKPPDFRLAPRYATLVAIDNEDGIAIDRGIALLFAAPHSYTAEDVLELQLHGGPVVLQMIVARCLAVAADMVMKSAPTGINAVVHADAHASMRLADPGEFTERAFLNDKLDLAQAEAVADLIEASSEAAVLGAQASLSGAFSHAVRMLVDQLIELRALVEATLDFPEEEIDFLEQSDARGRLERTRDALTDLLEQAKRGALLREGITVVLVGRPNVGKSSLLNALAESEVAIVTPIAGTTRDRVEEVIRLEGIALHIVDTAGIRELEGDDIDGAVDGALDGAEDQHAVERIGIARTWEAIAQAQVVLQIVDAASFDESDRSEDEAIARKLPPHVARRTIVNKIDLTGDQARIERGIEADSHGTTTPDRIYLSARQGTGIDLLRHELLAIAGWQPSGETGFLARERHLVAMRAAATHLDAAAAHADQGDRQLELFAEELRLAQIELDRITGEFSADDLLGEIFGRFCIGK